MSDIKIPEKKKSRRPGPGRPPMEIDRNQVLKLAEAGWTATAIAGFLGCSTDTVYRRVSAAEIQSAREQGDAKLMQAAYTRAMGGRIEKVLPDGTVQIQYLKSSDRLLQYMIDRRMGRVKQVVEVNPEPSVPANIRVAVTSDDIRKLVEKFENEY